MHSLTQRLRRLSAGASARLRALGVDQRGVSAVEFAMLLPLMVTMYLGSVEVGQGIAADRKVTLTARTVADLVSQVQRVDNAYMNNSLNAATAVMAPYPTGNLTVTVSSISINGQGVAKVSWSDSFNGAARAVNSTVSIPSALAVPNTSLIWSEVSYNYTPVIGYVVTGAISLKDQFFMRPRMTDITRVNS